ncbi:unnamed protein product [Leptosia nina]|uniref:Uncharacterized protein n=1 Tax=Leptosia nina TaxID=320188 RepID=A0AAV1JWL5_9NEOP
MYTLKRRRESVATVYKKTTKFLTANTANLLKKVPNSRKYCLLAKLVDDNEEQDRKANTEQEESDECSEDWGDRDLDYYLGVRKKETYWRDPIGKEQIKKDYLLYHCGVTEEEYEKFYKKAVSKPSHVKKRRLRQVPFKIHKKNKKAHSLRENAAEYWCEKKNIFKIFGNKRESTSASDSYSECDSDDDHLVRGVTKCMDGLAIFDDDDVDLEGVRIKEVSEGRPCDNCPELCPGFISHSWSERVINYQQVGKNRQPSTSSVRSHAQIEVSLSIEVSRCAHVSEMCLSLKQLEWAEICRRLRNKDVSEADRDGEKKIQKFPSRARNHAVRRKSNNNNMRSHVNCAACARVAEDER